MTASRIASSLAIAALIAFPAGAQAQTTLGQLAPGSSPEPTCSGPADLAPLGAASTMRYEVPSAGAITSWSTNAAAGAGQALTFKLVRPLGSGNFLVLAHDGPRQLTPGIVNTFRTAIPVQKGDLLVLSPTNNTPSACFFATPGSGDLLGATIATADGGTLHLDGGGTPDVRLNLATTFLSPPTITSVSPSSGPFRGGPTVTITGTEFANVTSVNFGAAPAYSFTVDSETQITAIPSGLRAVGSATSIDAPVNVTTIAGTAFSPSGSFSYRGCRSPGLAGKTVVAARQLLRRFGCRLGEVRRRLDARTKMGRILEQHPKAGKLLAPGGIVNLVVAGRRVRR